MLDRFRWLFTAGAFWSAFLLFSLQPMAGRLLLPRYGGSPAVWSTCLVFFQGVLLLGYFYAKAMPRFGARHRVVHVAVLVLPALALPIVLTAPLQTAGVWPLPSLIVALALTAGLPFFALSTHGSLSQRWYASGTGRDPYSLYAASNVGSLAGLLAYPLAIEPLLGLKGQGRAFAAGYALFATLAAACMWVSRREVLAGTEASVEPVPTRPAIASWIFRSFTPSLLLVACTLRITTDLVSLPLLWVLPLAIYLITWIFAFAPRVPFPRIRLELIGMLLVAVSLFSSNRTALPMSILLATTLGALFVVGWICHGDLARSRPPSAHLGTFYLALAVGGFLGGLAGNIAAPLLFDSIAEFPIALFLAAVAFAFPPGESRKTLASLQSPVALVALAAMVVVLVLACLYASGRAAATPSLAVLPLAAVVVSGMALWRWRGVFAASCALVTIVLLGGWLSEWRALDADRSFYGVLRVVQDGPKRLLFHGTTVHGSQEVDPLPSLTPLTYYYPESPLGSAIRTARVDARIGIVGLGAGSLAALATSGQGVDYFEIDPAVEYMARRWFTFLETSRAKKVAVIIGDARLSLDAPGSQYDLIVVDAFSSDAIPAHLLTVEAFEVYLARLAPGGVVLVHVSNRHLSLAPVVQGAAIRLELESAYLEWEPEGEADRRGGYGTDVVALARTRDALATLGSGWGTVPGDPVLWTDDFSSLARVLKY